MEAAAPLPVWLVGTPGEYNWQAVRALTEVEARLRWVCDFVGDDKCDDGGEPKDDCDCDFCCNFRDVDAQRYPQLDAKDTITPADWLKVGVGHVCSRCGEEAGPDDAHAVGAEAVCEYCMKLADWDIVDPERAAEIREDAAT
jgi:hypothetical protein